MKNKWNALLLYYLIFKKKNLEQMEFIKRRTKVFIIDISFMDRC